MKLLVNDPAFNRSNLIRKSDINSYSKSSKDNSFKINQVFKNVFPSIYQI